MEIVRNGGFEMRLTNVLSVLVMVFAVSTACTSCKTTQVLPGGGDGEIDPPTVVTGQYKNALPRDQWKGLNETQIKAEACKGVDANGLCFQVVEASLSCDGADQLHPRVRLIDEREIPVFAKVNFCTANGGQGGNCTTVFGPIAEYTTGALNDAGCGWVSAEVIGIPGVKLTCLGGNFPDPRDEKNKAHCAPQFVLKKLPLR